MTLRTKALVIISVALLGMAGLIYLTSRLTFIHGLEEIENRNVSQELNEALGALSYRISIQERNTADWASWDDTYAFIQDRNEEYIQSNLVDDTFITLGLNFIVYLDTGGEVVYSRGFDLVNEKEMQVPARFMEEIREDSPSGSAGTQDFISGLMSLDYGPLVVTSQPVLTSQGDGPSRGTLVFGRYIDSGFIEELSSYSLFPIAIQPVNGPLSKNFLDAEESLVAGNPIYMKTAGSNLIEGYRLVNDIEGQPSFIIQVRLDRDAFQLGQRAISLFVLSLLGAGLLIGGVTIFLIQKQVLSRFTSLIRGIDRIAETGDTSTRISMGGQDELSLVAGTVNGMLAAIQEAGTEIRESEERYRLLAENLTDVIWATDNELNFTYISPSIRELAGYSPDEAMKLKLEEILDEKSVKIVRRAFTEAERTNGEAAEDTGRPGIEVQIARKDGSQLWTEVKLSAIREPGGEVTGFAGVARDITERRQAEEELQKQYEQEHALREALEQEIQKRIEFTRALVHELKTPITPVLAATELLLDEVTDERLARLVKNIDRSASNLNQRIDELLDLARGEIDTLELDLETIDLLPLFNDIVSDMEPVAEQYGQVLKAELPAELPPVKADTGRLRQVILNILNNAFKFTPTGGKVTFKAGKDGDNLVVEISDTGPGISREDQKRLFDPYFRRPGDRERLSGLGLGLALSKRLIELHGGDMWVDSHKGQGSSFYFSIPVIA